MLFGLDPSSLIARVVVLLVAFTIHEFAHAWTADRFGDTTPRLFGRLTLNPLAHLDPLGTILLLVARFGWAKPVPINPYALRKSAPSAVMWVSLAGPLSNLLMAILASIPFRAGLLSVNTAIYDAYQRGSHLLPSLPQLFFEFIIINLSLLLFNLIPLAPLDGEKVAEYLFPPAWARVLDSIRPYGPLILMGIFILGPLFNLNIVGYIIGKPLLFLLQLLTG